MIQPITVLFLFVAALFAMTHMVAVEFSLYWYYWWFDILMHFWGGVLIALGLFAFGTFTRFRTKPSLVLVMGVTLTIIVSWEVFEWFAALYDPRTYVVDTAQDMFIGLAGSLIGYAILKKLKK